MDDSWPGSSDHGILQARILEWVAISSSSGSSWPGNWTHASYSLALAGGFFTTSTTWEACTALVDALNSWVVVSACIVSDLFSFSPCYHWLHLVTINVSASSNFYWLWKVFKVNMLVLGLKQGQKYSVKIQEASHKSDSWTLVQALGGMYFAYTMACSLIPLLLNVFQRMRLLARWLLHYLLITIHNCYQIVVIIIWSDILSSFKIYIYKRTHSRESNLHWEITCLEEPSKVMPSMEVPITKVLVFSLEILPC